ncbi:hypothetical protein JRO89_XS01G0043200 [Xanthoceras sorbifolium]|uniref:Zinc knuckle CX2CX4HX4C domain-containing protein n=1 Tax=Xanthoceras sorbifolium TaxID=99658 RepID=A0ABQ8IIP5_9ROSI|nr:hypothetical protein JRO89_XS01G0043200 [Xanthoceras sorbifolium]
MVLSGGPWNFNNDLLVLEEPNGLGIFLTELVGKSDDIDLGASGNCLILFRYERLPNYSVHCGHLRHVVRFCPTTVDGVMPSNNLESGLKLLPHQTILGGVGFVMNNALVVLIIVCT